MKNRSTAGAVTLEYIVICTFVALLWATLFGHAFYNPVTGFPETSQTIQGDNFFDGLGDMETLPGSILVDFMNRILEGIALPIP